MNELELARHLRRGQLNENFRAKIKQGHLFSGWLISFDDRAVSRMATVLAELRAGESGAHGGFWICQDNERIELNDSEAVFLLASAITARLELDQAYLEARDEINAATTEEEILAVEIEIGGGS
ncbi:MAG: hypothetical protein CL793_07770 [Chloroflexi bacterium]|nr:hypothetical protein [Chloroflexota bacterium]|tara:strand:+ start:16590 stop:16961 length:372 start_codon:yes stop_codon:yes gene_type:complete